MTLRDIFLLDPTVAFLNHGSFGAAPRPVMQDYQEWQIRLEREPVQFMATELPGLLARAREALGGFVGARPEDLVFVPNATYAVNAVARSIKLDPGDEVLATDHEYGACDRTWEFACLESGARYVRQPISLPAESSEAIVDQLWHGVTPRTRLIALSHITSPTALTLPAESIGRRAREQGILTLIDGAHAPGQIPLHLATLGVDFYAGNCHKWMMAPKGAGFLFARPEVQGLVQPLVVSWGWQPEPWFTTGSPFVDLFEWGGTDDPAAFLAVPAAIEFMSRHEWSAVRAECHALLRRALQEIGEQTGLAGVYAANDGLYHQMGIAPLPPVGDVQEFQKRLYVEHRVEVPVLEWNSRPFVRISVQGYNTQADLDRLRQALGTLLSNTPR
ncbi:MAG: aminotransferase class V-fold PLP-dependent enzyme [Anaerolineales bacterium]